MEDSKKEILIKISKELDEGGNPEEILSKMIKDFSISELEEFRSFALEHCGKDSEYSPLLLIAIKLALDNKILSHVKDVLKEPIPSAQLQKAAKVDLSWIPSKQYEKDLQTMGLLSLINFSTFILLMILIS